MKPRTLGFAVESNTFNVKFRPSHSTWKILNGVAGRGHTATAVTPAWVKSMIFLRSGGALCDRRLPAAHHSGSRELSKTCKNAKSEFGHGRSLFNLGASPPTHCAEFARIVAVSGGVVIVDDAASGDLA